MACPLVPGTLLSLQGFVGEKASGGPFRALGLRESTLPLAVQSSTLRQCDGIGMGVGWMVSFVRVALVP